MGLDLLRLLRATRAVIRDDDIPRWLRWAGAFGVAPIPGPFDEIVLVLVTTVLALFYRTQLKQAWKRAA